MNIIIILIQLLFIAGNIWMAYYHAGLFKRDIKIRHWAWGGGYAVAALLTGFINWWLAASLLLIRLPLFNELLNKLRGKGWFYLGKESLLDRILSKSIKINGKSIVLYRPVFFADIIAFFICEIILFL